MYVDVGPSDSSTSLGSGGVEGSAGSGNPPPIVDAMSLSSSTSNSRCWNLQGSRGGSSGGGGGGGGGGGSGAEDVVVVDVGGRRQFHAESTSCSSSLAAAANAALESSSSSCQRDCSSSLSSSSFSRPDGREVKACSSTSPASAAASVVYAQMQTVYHDHDHDHDKTYTGKPLCNETARPFLPVPISLAFCSHLYHAIRLELR